MENHPDILDIASDLAEAEREALAKIRKPVPVAVGKCYNCEAVLPQGHFFCDSGCRDDFELWEKMQTIAGTPE